MKENRESARPKVVELFSRFRKEEMREKVWEHATEEFKRITGCEAA